MINSAVFDHIANEYDQEFTHSRLGRMLRPRVWQVLSNSFSAGQHVLELTCGTGEDAVWLAQQGVHITATDGSAVMTQLTTQKAQQAGVTERVTAVQLSLQELLAVSSQQSAISSQLSNPRSSLLAPRSSLFDGIYSNFGGLNTIGDFSALAKTLSGLVRPGGKVVLVPMGPVCPWETGWHLLHGEFGVAVRRWRKTAVAKIGPDVIPIWYPSTQQLKKTFAPWFRHLQTLTLGLWLPPSYLDHLVNRWPRLFTRLNQFEKSTAHLTKGWGDHYIIIFEKK